ncbi:E3 ubiquitin-protein ligase TRIM71-like [Mytilus trossulus]|uniref:E3 ubiquitin-protein ligase TRIM71-like n=1 Tax=Mytilus trossulus TaxID=6551 RepID=UPI0030075011
MATASFCDPCTKANLSVSATKYCSDCEERLCPACVESHARFKAFTSHHVIDLSSIDFNIPVSAKKICDVHPDILLDYYCTDHELVCCRACIPKDHRKCEKVLPLEHASKDVKKSALFTDVMQDIKHLITTLTNVQDNRESNLQRLSKTRSVITKQISEVKSRLLKQIDDLERDLQTELSSLQRKYETEINMHKEEITKILNSLKTKQKEVDFLKDHGSNNQIFHALHQQVSSIKSAEVNVQKIVSNSHEIDIAFDEKKDIRIDLFGQLSETVTPCKIQYNSKKIQQAQIMIEQIKCIVKFEKDTELKLKAGLKSIYDLSITVNNKLLLTSWSDSTLYIYRDCNIYETEIILSSKPFGVVVIPGTDRASVTLPHEDSIQFINTTKMTKDGKVDVGFICYGITAQRERVYVGGMNGTIKTLDTNGNILKTIKLGSGNIDFLAYDDSQEQFFVRGHNKLQCIKLDGTLVYSKDVSGTAGVMRDRQGNIYYGGNLANNIERMSSDGENSEEMLNKDNGILRPYGMCFNNDFTKLFVINNSYTSVFVYNCRY